MRVVLLGAGASKSYTASLTAEQMPVARDFLEVCSRLSVSRHPWTMTWAIRGYLKQTRGITLEQFAGAGEDIEVFHSEVEDAWLRALESGEQAAAVQAHATYTQLVFLFAAAVNAIQNGPPSVSHIHLAQVLTADDRVITFNWDTLMDRALAETQPWSTDWGYGAVPR